MSALVSCACGCGTKFERKDSSSRIRKFVSGHNRRKYHGIHSTTWARCKRWAKKNPEKVRKGKRVFYRQRKLRAMAYLGNACFFCPTKYNGENAPIFEFHHERPKQKTVGLTRILTRLTWRNVLKELRKCVLSCANCHNQHHGGGKW